MDLTPAELDRIRRIVRARAMYYRATVATHHHISVEDLEQDGMIRAIAAHRDYRQPWNYNTFISTAANRGIISAVRHVTGVGKPRPTTSHFASDPVSSYDRKANYAKSLPAFVQVAMRVGHNELPASRGHGSVYGHPTMAAMAAVRLDYKWSWRAMVMLLDTSELRKSLEVVHLPHFDVVRHYEEHHGECVELVFERAREFFG